jgi:formylglycine-generating enzyme required for sulfatase activity
MRFVLIPAGNFCMGSASGEEDEKPVHLVTFSRAFYMGKYEVTQDEWQTVMGGNPMPKQCLNCPVALVSWLDTQIFIKKLNESDNEFWYRLPTEAEWEYACRAGTAGDYAGKLSKMAWYFETSGTKAHPVGGKQPNAWGLADMHGNVWEWCQDWYHETYYGAPNDGSAWLEGGEQIYRVARGGSWTDDAKFGSMRSAFRGLKYQAPQTLSVLIGFRLVVVPRTQ